MLKYLCIACFVFLSGCAVVDYENAAPGQFKGSLVVLWVDGNRNAGDGDGLFIYVPFGDDALTFVRNDASSPSPGSETLRPEAFYTDGGSVPRGLQFIPGFNAWGYGPAYIIHDWLFRARRCLNDNQGTPEMRKISSVTFDESAKILAETIRTLKGDQVSGSLIPRATAGPISYRQWKKTGSCKGEHISKEHQEIIDGLLSAQRSFGTDSVLRNLITPRGLRSLNMRNDDQIRAVSVFQLN